MARGPVYPIVLNTELMYCRYDVEMRGPLRTNNENWNQVFTKVYTIKQ